MYRSSDPCLIGPSTDTRVLHKHTNAIWGLIANHELHCFFF